MTTPVFLTVDTELLWRHHAAGLDAATIVHRSLEPAGVGVSFQLALMARYGLKGCFFVDPMPAMTFGLDPIRRVVDAVLDAGQEIQLHLHANWTGARSGDGGSSSSRFELIDYTHEEQRDLITGARDLLVAAGAPHPIAFRGGSYSANDDTLAALAELDFLYDSSHNGGEHPWPSAIGLPTRQIAPIAHAGVIELPVTLIEERPDTYRHFQVCALSSGEMGAALDHAVTARHAAVTIVSHSFELANRAGTRPNNIHVRRFESLCAQLAERRDDLPTTWFSDRPALRLGQKDEPLAPHHLRTRWRQAEQLWSNMIAERAA